jgi:flavin-dependent dehydrogenase
MNSITIVGGGTAGLVTALILKTRLKVKIKAIVPSNIGIIGVGEGSTEHFDDFKQHLNLDVRTVLKETNGTLKSGIMFEGWNTKHKKYLHHIQHLWQLKFGLNSRNYEYLMSHKYSAEHFVPKCFFKNKVELIDPNGNLSQYHFNTFKLNEYLTKLCKERNIDIIDDEIVNVKINKQGIQNLKGKKATYKSCFYIDCTGFKKLLISKLGAKWKSYSKYLKTNSAIAFPTEDQKEYNIWTLSKAMKYGWMWQIPTYGRTGNGYVFSNKYTDKEGAKKEVEKLLGKEIQIAKHIEYDPGALDKPWIKNCAAVGLCANFVEPLEATSIGTTIQQAFLLMQYLDNYTERTINTYNKQVKTIMENIRDFIQLHYITDKKNTDFWKDVSKVEPSDTLKQYLEIWKSGHLIKGTDMEVIGPYNLFSLFKEDNFNMIAYFNGLINISKLKQNYYSIDKSLQKYWFEKNIKNGIILRNNTIIGTKSHKEFIKEIHA